jgi:hypothetical protein
MSLQRINDERLILKNLQNIRVAYAIQTLGIIGVLGYDYITKGMDGMKENPLWIIFIVSTTILAFLSMNISVDFENNKKSPKRGFVISIVVLTLICTSIGFFTALSEGFTVMDGVFIGGIFLICGMVPLLFLFGIRKKRRDEFSDDE